MKILYIEDNVVNLSLIQRIAQMNQHELIAFDEAEIALAELDKGLQVDLILLDIQLAGEMDGIDFAKVLRGRGDQRPIIAITAYAMMGDKERILEAGCNEYLPKPLPIAEFLTLLAKYDPSVYKTPAPEEKKPAEPPKAEATPAAPSTVVATPTPASEAAKPAEPPKTEASPSTSPTTPPKPSDEAAKPPETPKAPEPAKADTAPPPTEAKTDTTPKPAAAPEATVTPSPENKKE